MERCYKITPHGNRAIIADGNVVIQIQKGLPIDIRIISQRQLTFCTTYTFWINLGILSNLKSLQLVYNFS